MSSISYRPLQAEDVDAVFDAAWEAWRFTYATIFDAVFVDQFVRTNYAPDRLRTLVPAVAAQQMFFDLALEGDHIVGFCHIGVTPRGAELFRIYLTPPTLGWACVVGSSSVVSTSCGRDACLPITVSSTRTTSSANGSICVGASGTSPASIGTKSGTWRKGLS
jgi:hypothetical protein